MSQIKLKSTGAKYNYSKRKDGRLCVRIPIGIKSFDDKGNLVNNYKSIYGRNELELKENLEAYFENKELKSYSKKVFTEAIVSWLKLSCYGKVENSTYDRYEETVLYQIIPAAKKLDHKLITEITVDDVKQMMMIIENMDSKQHPGKKISQSTVKKAKVLIKAFFDDKVFDGSVAFNPARYKERGSRKHKTTASGSGNTSDGIYEIEYLSEEEVDKVKNIIFNGYETKQISRTGNSFTCHNKVPQGEYFIFMLNTGLRVGEAAALKYSDIDFDKHTMSVNRTFKSVKKRDKDGCATGEVTLVESAPKTDESRETVKINDTAINILKNMLKNEPKGYTGYIVHGTRNYSRDDERLTHISANALYKRWRTICGYAGIHTTKSHAIRHTTASFLFAVTNGNAALVSELLRHKDVAFTEREYIDIIEKYRESMFENFSI